jgi:hypothetical protein
MTGSRTPARPHYGLDRGEHATTHYETSPTSRRPSSTSMTPTTPPSRPYVLGSASGRSALTATPHTRLPRTGRNHQKNRPQPSSATT